MHDPKIIEAMARAIGSRLVLRGSVNDAATDALRDLCAARPDVAAVLDGEAVAVPANGPTADMAIAWGAPAGFFGGWRAMLAASPYAPPECAP